MALLDFMTSTDPMARERRLRLAQGLAGMSLRPNVGLQTAIQGQLDDIKAQRDKTAAANLLAKQTTVAQQLLGDKFPKLTGALQAGIISPKDAITAARQGGDVKVVGKALVDMQGNVLYRDTDDDEPATVKKLKWQAKEAGLEEGTQAYKEFILRGGASQGMALTIGADGTITFAEGGAQPIKMTEGQSNAAGFYSRMAASGPTIDKFETQGTNFGQALLSGVPFDMANWAKTPEFQQYEQAKRDFINAQLRKESGAVIGKDEFANAERQYFPVIGDSPEVIAQKRRNRWIAIEAMKLSAGLLGVPANTGAQQTTTSPIQANNAIDAALADLSEED